MASTKVLIFSPLSILKVYCQAIRPQQWTKNLIVFAAPLFGFEISWNAIQSCLLAFGLFCAISSGFYLLNDIADVKRDRLHPVKCKRPIAAGLISIPSALSFAFCLFSGVLIISWWQSKVLALVLICYSLVQIVYNLKLKRVVILDGMAIASGFVLRALAGAVVTGIELSTWFLLCTGMLALFLAVEKRKAELRITRNQHTSTRPVLQQYSLSLLNRMENTVTTGTIMTYALWSSGPQLNGASTPWMLITVPLVLYGVFRYQFLSESSELMNGNTETEMTEPMQTERPEDILLKDLPILLTVISWVVTIFTILFLKNNGIID